MTKHIPQKESNNKQNWLIINVLWLPFSKLNYFFKKNIISPLKMNIFTQKNKPLVLCILLFMLAGDIFFTQTNSDIRFFGISLLFLITALLYQMRSKVTFIVCLILLCLMYVEFLLSGAVAITEKIAVWIVLLMIVGIIQQWKE